MLCLGSTIGSPSRARRVLPFLQFIGVQMLLLRLSATYALPQPANDAASPSGFASATVTRAKSREPGNSMRVHERRFEAKNVSLVDLIAFAWNLTPKQIEGNPDWTSEERFDLSAEEGGDSQPTVDQLRAMVRDFLHHRFQLESHREKRLLDAFIITTGSQGAQMKFNSSDPVGLPSIALGAGELTAHNARIAELAETLQRSVMAAPVLDETGLSGKYDFSLEWSANIKGSAGLDESDLEPAMHNLGLRLTKGRASVDVLVIGHLSRPILD